MSEKPRGHQNIDPDGYDYQINEKGTIKLNAEY